MAVVDRTRFTPSTPFIESTAENLVDADRDYLWIEYLMMTDEQLVTTFGPDYLDTERFKKFMARFDTREGQLLASVRLMHSNTVLGTSVTGWLGKDAGGRPAIYGRSMIYPPLSMPVGLKEARILHEAIRQRQFKVSVRYIGLERDNGTADDFVCEVSLTKNPKVEACEITRVVSARASLDQPQQTAVCNFIVYTVVSCVYSIACVVPTFPFPLFLFSPISHRSFFRDR